MINQSSLQDGFTFVWIPRDTTNNAILDGNCYFQYFGGLYIQVTIDDNVIVGCNWYSEEYQWVYVYPFVVCPYAKPNQSSYTIRFQAYTGGLSAYVKDINILLEVMDGLPRS